jgi:hypothetical protein
MVEVVVEEHLEQRVILITEVKTQPSLLRAETMMKSAAQGENRAGD